MESITPERSGKIKSNPAPKRPKLIPKKLKKTEKMYTIHTMLFFLGKCNFLYMAKKPS